MISTTRQSESHPLHLALGLWQKDATSAEHFHFERWFLHVFVCFCCQSEVDSALADDFGVTFCGAVALCQGRFTTGPEWQSFGSPDPIDEEHQIGEGLDQKKWLNMADLLSKLRKNMKTPYLYLWHLISVYYLDCFRFQPVKT